MIHALRAFRHRDFRLFFCGQSLSLIGTWIQQIAMAWLVYRLTGSAFLLGLAAFAGQIPILVLAPLGGIWADRFDRRQLLMVTQVLAMVQALALALLTYTGLIQVWHIIAMATALGVIMALDAPLRQTIVDDEMRGRIMSFFTVAFLGVSPLGSLAAGALANAVGAEHTLFIGGACCVLGAIVLWRQLPRLRANIRPIYVRLGIIQE